MLKYRLISAFCIVSAVLAAAFLAPSWILFVVVLALALLGTYEFITFLDHAHIRSFKELILTGAFAYVTGVYVSFRYSMILGPEEVAVSILCLFVFGVCLSSVFTPQSGNPMHGLFASIGALLYVPFLFSFLLFLLFDWPADDGRILVLYLLFVVKMTDVGAYFTGRWIGKTKLIPRISPAKTWEGCAGGVATALLTSIIFWYSCSGDMRVTHLQWHDAAVLGLFLPVLGILGDLVESMFKRAANVKDSSTMIRGMGGILDVTDSLLFAVPALYLYARLFL